MVRHYVLGFLWDEARENVVLIRKNKPEWQKGSWNGVGGKIEGNEYPLQAMVREFKEETGVDTDKSTWNKVGDILFHNGSVMYLYSAYDEKSLKSVRTAEEEVVEVAHAVDIFEGGYRCVRNLSWLLPLTQNFISTSSEGNVAIQLFDELERNKDDSSI